MKTLKTAEANYIFLHSELENEKYSDFIKAFILNELGQLDYAANEKIFSVKNTKFSFNVAGIELNKTRVFEINDFHYNACTSFIAELFEKQGEEIYDHRFKGYYLFTKRHLKLRFEKSFVKWVSNNRSITHDFIAKMKTKALELKRQQLYSFNLKWNGIESAERNDLTFNS